MTVINQNIVSFRCHRSMVSWVDTIAPLFLGGRSGFLRLLLIRVVLEQPPPARGISKLFKKEQQLELPIGTSHCFAVRVSDTVKTLIVEAATERGQTVAQWAATAMYNWRFRFKNYQDIKEQKEGIPRNQWLPGYVQLFTENVRKSPSVYARLRGRPPVLAVSDTLVPQGMKKNRSITGDYRQKITVLTGRKG
jgi:hypothetical protein